MSNIIPFEVSRLCFVCCEETTPTQPNVELAFCLNCRNEPWLDHLLRHAAIGEMVLGSPEGTSIHKSGPSWNVKQGDKQTSNPDLEIALMDLFEVV